MVFKGGRSAFPNRLASLRFSLPVHVLYAIALRKSTAGKACKIVAKFRESEFNSDWKIKCPPRASLCSSPVSPM